MRFSDPAESEASLALRDGDHWIVTDVRADGALSVRHATSRLHTTLPADYVTVHVELGYASTVHTAQGITTDVVHGIVTGTEDRQMLYTMLTRGRGENHAHIVLGTDASHALPSPVLDRSLTATEVLEGILARDGAAVSATSVQARAASPAALLQDAVARYADAVALATSQLRAEPAEDGPLPWLAGIPSDVAELPGWGPYLAARSRRVMSLAAEVAADPVLPEWMDRYDGDVLTPESATRAGRLARSHRCPR
ncbi:MAG: ATP-binding domain-containing protein [Dermatophilaceae bacterium]